ncbi:MAG: glycoside hydrolase family 16 protein [Planctomycetes bacterium]|nr:glycoside hydrolase family 16 protein [Planctomycetota bacterium]
MTPSLCRFTYPLVVTALFAVCLAAPVLPGVDEPASIWKLVWSDEFDGTQIDRTKWDYDVGNGFYSYDANQWISGWGNNELQYYTRAPENAFVKDGMLHIRAIKESLHGCGYTSARLKTKKRDGTALFARKYGRFEFRAKLPTGKGIWPALWMLPQDDKYGPWPASGEIDVMEARGHEPGKVLGTLHFGSRWPANTHAGKDYILPDKGTIAAFHVYTLEWEPGAFRWYVDGKRAATQSFWWSSGKRDAGKGVAPAREADLHAWPAPFNQPFYLIMNVAVGGRFPGNPENATHFPAEMIIDHVRVYDKVGSYGPTPPRGKGKLPFAKG